ncbi:radical SAM domain iron-sulfur cluster-binding oxidoreductase [Geotalea daltonii FRC-32]|uniref:Radical SAM domain iron-sulfur cluster-binding oxidoreductase n=1 Tax=Geotalea daltonii (strain DSM 22248 / JCM 15807 / FRC-32) TaxID=316067 RepID=B9M4Y6_GEODF|nr:radical SAM protein [Geotalea daltonii]ACM21670.1 radical SAM domain iron-sulfur cluster-binding oxidoreductase [Geotalea daltonii FRC-32]
MKTATSSHTSFIQIEITTICNFDCFYCAGRNMPQRHMGLDLFNTILASLPLEPCTISLQGEGEPTLHPHFISMAKQVIEAGHIPYTITNCSCLDASVIAEVFPQIGVSLDTLDPGEAQRLGRHDLRQVVENLDRLLQRMGPDRVILHTVNYGQQMERFTKLVESRGFSRHIVQPLQMKDDYRKRYCNVPVGPQGWKSAHYLGCRYLQQPLMRYFDVNGREMPCCYIKDASKFVSTDHARSVMGQGRVPDCCAGCREITMGRS